MKTVDIPGGQATLREKSDLRVRDRRLVEAAAVAAGPLMARLPQDPEQRAAISEVDLLSLGISRQEIQTMFDMQDAAIIAALASWTLQEPLPTMDTLGDLNGELYDALGEVTSGVGAEVAAETFDPPDPASPGFEASPTVPLAVSEPHSDSQGQESELTGTSPSTGTSTSSAAPSQD